MAAYSFERKRPRFKQQPRLLVLCEDLKSSRSYLADAAKHYRCHVEVQIVHCGHTDCIGIVRHAIAQRYKFEEVYCVIDRDDHPSFEDAIKLASDRDICIVDSHPCYEYWLLLHFRYTRAPYTPVGQRSAADRVLQALTQEAGMQGYQKGVTKGLFDRLLPSLSQAKRHAVQAYQDAEESGEKNPSTQLHILLDRLEAFGLSPILAQ